MQLLETGWTLHAGVLNISDRYDNCEQSFDKIYKYLYYSSGSGKYPTAAL